MKEDPDVWLMNCWHNTLWAGGKGATCFVDETIARAGTGAATMRAANGFDYENYDEKDRNRLIIEDDEDIYKPAWGVLELVFDAAAGTLRFERGGEVLGEHTGVPAAAKLVVSGRRLRNEVRLL